MAENDNVQYMGGLEADSKFGIGGKSKQIVVFRVGKEDYGLEIEKVQEVIRMKTIKKLPRSPGFVLGVMNLRGNIIPIIGLRQKFGLPSVPYDEFTRVVVVNHDEKLVGMVVDEVNRVLNVPESSIESTSEIVRDNTKALVRGVAKVEDQVVILIELDYLIYSFEEMSHTEH